MTTLPLPPSNRRPHNRRFHDRRSDDRRSADRLYVPFFLAGLSFMVLAVGLKFLEPTTSDWLIIVLAVLGAAMLPTDRVLGLVRVWRKNG